MTKLLMKTIGSGNHHTLVSTDDGYEFLDEPDCVAVLPYYFDDAGVAKFFIRQEVCPAYQNKEMTEDLFYTPIGGQIDENESVWEAIYRELYEEAGITVNSDENIITLYQLPLTKGSNVRVTYALVQLHDIEQSDAPGDGTKWEELSETIEVDYNQLGSILNSNRCDVSLVLLASLVLIHALNLISSVDSDTER